MIFDKAIMMMVNYGMINDEIKQIIKEELDKCNTHFARNRIPTMIENEVISLMEKVYSIDNGEIPEDLILAISSVQMLCMSTYNGLGNMPVNDRTLVPLADAFYRIHYYKYGNSLQIDESLISSIIVEGQKIIEMMKTIHHLLGRDGENTEKRVTCYDCPHRKILYDADNYTMRLSCTATSKRGKTITWTSYPTYKSINPLTQTEDTIESITEKFIDYSKRRLAPSWCPIRKELEK